MYKNLIHLLTIFILISSCIREERNTKKADSNNENLGLAQIDSLAYELHNTLISRHNMIKIELIFTEKSYKIDKLGRMSLLIWVILDEMKKSDRSSIRYNSINKYVDDANKMVDEPKRFNKMNSLPYLDSNQLYSENNYLYCIKFKLQVVKFYSKYLNSI